MIRPIRIYGDPVLRQECEPVRAITDDVRELARDMVETMIDADGVGLAAPQVGVPIQLAVVDVAHAPELQTFFRVNGVDAPLADFMPLIFVNPRIETKRRRVPYTEGCLSFPGVRYEIMRPDEVRAHLTLLDGRNVVIETDGLLSRAIQHESDHLHGRLFIDRLSAADRLGLKKRLQQMFLEIKEEDAESKKSLAPES